MSNMTPEALAKAEEAPNTPAPPPTAPGFYRYSGGRQTMIFLLMRDGEWFAYFDNGEGPLKCDWGYIEQALGVYTLVKLDTDSDDYES